MESILWESREAYREWESHRIQNDKLIQDLNLLKLYDEVYQLSEFSEFSYSKSIFLNPCTRKSTIIYRQNIVEEIYYNDRLYKVLREFCQGVFDLGRKYKKAKDSKDELHKEIATLEVIHAILVFLDSYYQKLSAIVNEKDALNPMINALKAYDFSNNEDRDVRLLEYVSELNKAYSFDLVLNKTKEQVVESAFIQRVCDRNPQDFTEKLYDNVSRFFECKDQKINVYQTVDLTEFDCRLQKLCVFSKNSIHQETKSLYDTYKNFEFSSIITMADELVFYLSYIRFMKLYRENGFYFVKPQNSENHIYVEDGYDLSLGVNQYHQYKKNHITANTYEFNEKEPFFILTGANQGGKTTFLRSVGIIQMLYQIGVYVPAKYAMLRVVPHVYTHFSCGDEEGAQGGRFEQELYNIRSILADIEPNSMILLNEPFSSTQRSVATILLRKLLLMFWEKRCIGGLVTHFYEIFDELPKECFYSLVPEVDFDSMHSRTYKIVKKNSENKSYAMDIARKLDVSYEKLAQIVREGD